MHARAICCCSASALQHQYSKELPKHVFFLLLHDDALNILVHGYFDIHMLYKKEDVFGDIVRIVVYGYADSEEFKIAFKRLVWRSSL